MKEMDDDADLEEAADLDEAADSDKATDLNEAADLDKAADSDEAADFDEATDLDEAADLEEATVEQLYDICVGNVSCSSNEFKALIERFQDAVHVPSAEDGSLPLHHTCHNGYNEYMHFHIARILAMIHADCRQGRGLPTAQGLPREHIIGSHPIAGRSMAQCHPFVRI